MEGLPNSGKEWVVRGMSKFSGGEGTPPHSPSRENPARGVRRFTHTFSSNLETVTQNIFLNCGGI